MTHGRGTNNSRIRKFMDLAERSPEEAAAYAHDSLLPSGNEKVIQHAFEKLVASLPCKKAHGTAIYRTPTETEAKKLRHIFDKAEKCCPKVAEALRTMRDGIYPPAIVNKYKPS